MFQSLLFHAPNKEYTSCLKNLEKWEALLWMLKERSILSIKIRNLSSVWIVNNVYQCIFIYYHRPMGVVSHFYWRVQNPGDWTRLTAVLVLNMVNNQSKIQIILQSDRSRNSMLTHQTYCFGHLPRHHVHFHMMKYCWYFNTHLLGIPRAVDSTDRKLVAPFKNESRRHFRSDRMF